MAKAPVDMSEAAHQAGEAAFAEAIELAAGRGRLPIVYEKLDAFCDEALRGAPIACKAGCSTCCHQWVPGVKASEIEQIAQRAVGDRALVAALQVRLQAYERLSGDRDLEYARLGLSCVFLTAEGTCGIREI